MVRPEETWSAGAGHLRHEVVPVALQQGTDVRVCVSGPVGEVIERLRAAASDAADRPDAVTLLLTVPDAAPASASPLWEAVFEALRGVIQAVTLEVGDEGPRLNLVRVAAGGDPQHALDLLGSQAGAFIAGATIDLTGEFE